MNKRSSTWAFIVYPDSAPQDWKRILQLKVVASCVSPLHSPDPDGSGEERKKHYHVMLQYDSLKSFEQVESLSKSINGCSPIIIDCPSKYYDYLIHKNNPEKEQFKNGYDSIEKFNGFDSDKFEEYSKKQIAAFKKDIIRIIEKYDICEYETLLTYLMDNEEVENYNVYFQIVSTNTILFNTFISSRRNRLHKQEVNNLQKRLSILERKIQNESNGE